MFAALRNVLGFVALPVIAVLVGSVLAMLRPPGPRAQSYIQHFAAGVVFAAVAGEVLPEITHQRAPLEVILGFALGVAAMLGIRRLAERMKSEEGEGVAQPFGLVVTVGVDVFIDGLLVGVGFAAGAETGILLTIALTVELLFLALSTVASQIKAAAPRRTIVLTTTALASLVAIGAVLGVTLLAGLSGPALEVVLSFGAAALLFLVTEELLVEAHEVPETVLSTASFFLGFLVLFVIEILALPPAG
jgi:zinc transporter, ZIP family